MKLKLRSEVKVGIFALITLVFLYWGINFLKGQDLFKRNSTYYATYEEVSGLQKSGSVVVKGFRIGLVSDIIYDPQKSDKIIVEMSIRSKYKIPENSTAKIFSDGLLGGKAIEIEFGPSQMYLHSGDTIRSETDHGMLGFSGSDIEYIKQKAGQLINDLSATLSNINSLVGDNSESINQIFSNIAGMTGTLNNVLASEQGSLRGIISDINELSSTLKNNTGRIDNILGNVEGFTDSLRRADIPALVDNLSGTLKEFNTLLADINAGEGSVGKLLGDDGLYDSLVEASANLARLLEDVKENPQRYINISVFGGNKSK
ncbi:MAG: MlaD family protein [Alistipes sp.]|nr:MlaD family protein [Alistipes sp.]